MDWLSTEVGELDHFLTSGSRGWAQYYSDSGDLFIRITNLKRDTIALDLSNCKYVNLPNHSTEGQRTKVEIGDILISVTADLGIIGYIDESIPLPAYVNQHIALVRIYDEKVYTRYLAYSLATTQAHHQFLRFNDSGAKAGLSLSTIRKFPVILPPLAEQRKIAEILGTWDEAIAQVEQLLAALQQRKQGLMQRLLTGQVRFKAFEGKRPWEEVKIGSVCKSFSGGTPSRSKKHYYGGSIPWIKSGEINQVDIFSTEETISEEGLQNSSAKVVEKDTLLLALYGATAGKVGFTRISAAINQALLAVIPNNSLDKTYLFYELQNQMSEILRKLQGGQPNLSGKLVKESTIFLPPLEEQRKIATVLQTCDNEIQLLQQQHTALQQQKKGLMQRLLTGQIRVTPTSKNGKPLKS